MRGAGKSCTSDAASAPKMKLTSCVSRSTTTVPPPLKRRTTGTPAASTRGACSMTSGFLCVTDVISPQPRRRARVTHPDRPSTAVALAAPSLTMHQLPPSARSSASSSFSCRSTDRPAVRTSSTDAGCNMRACSTAACLSRRRCGGALHRRAPQRALQPQPQTRTQRGGSGRTVVIHVKRPAGCWRAALPQPSQPRKAERRIRPRCM